MFLKTSLLGGAAVASAATLHGDPVAGPSSPVSRVVELIRALKVTIEADGKMEQQVYDKFACWCEETTNRKKNDIANAEDRIEELTTTIEENSGRKGTFQAEISQLKKDIAANEAARADASAIRNKQNAEYSKERMEAEQTIGALENATKVLDGAGTRKHTTSTTSFMRKAETLSVVKGIEESLAKLPLDSSVTDEDKQVLNEFLAHPEKNAFLQNTHNPFGDYAPASTQIQGILKNMYETFVAQLERSNGEEAKQNKLYKELIATKEEEHDTLTATLMQKESAHAENGEALVENKEERADQQKQMATDKKFLEQTKANCVNNADAWSERSRLRTEELAGIDKAIDILSSNEDLFVRSNTSFLQESRQVKPHNLKIAADKISAIARKNKSIRFAALAVQVRAGGHFDAVIRIIDKMMATIRVEDKDDIEAKKRCKAEYVALGSDQSDLDRLHVSKKLHISKLQQDATKTQDEIGTAQLQIEGVEKEMQDALNIRTAEKDDFHKALQDDKDAAATVGKAIEALKAFYKNNDVKLGLAQEDPAPQEFANNPDAAPQGFTKDDPYGGKKSESHGIVAILTMLKEDMENEIKESITAEEKAQEEYVKNRAAAMDEIKEKENTKVTLETKSAKLAQEITTAQTEKSNLENKQDSNSGLYKAHCTECAWIYSTEAVQYKKLQKQCPTLSVSEVSSFQTRKEKRNAELQGLSDAKSSLAGAGIEEDNATTGATPLK